MKSMQLTTLSVAIALALPVFAAGAAETVSETPTVKTTIEKNTKKHKLKDTEEIEVVTVTGVHLADLKARTLERESDSYSSVIATDDLGNFVDQNVAESLRRLPGVTLERSEGEGTHVSIRGLGPNFVSVTMNGNEMAGADDSRAVGLAGITGDSLGSIEVFKTLTPEMNLNSIGGMVNVKAISAYDKGKESLKFKVQNSYQVLSEQHSPKFSVDGTEFFLDKKIGIGFSGGFENRKTHVEESRQHDTAPMTLRQADIGYVDGSVQTVTAYGDQIIAPSQFERRLEDAGRERTTANLNLEFRPNDTSQYYIRGNYSKYADNDIALREKFDFADAGGIGSGETAYVSAATKEFIVTDIDVQNQFFIQEGDNVTKTFSIGGKNFLGDATILDYAYAHSESVSEINDGHRTQFRERDLIVLGQGLRDRINAKVLTAEQAAEISGLDIAVFDGANNSDVQGDASSLSNFELDNIFLEDSNRIDELDSFKINLRQNFYYDHLSYIKIGGASSKRVHTRGKDRWSFIPKDGDCQGNEECLAVQTSSLADYTNEIPVTGNFVYPLPVRDEVEYITSVSKSLAESATGGGVAFESTSEDYQINEDTYALYAMAEIPFSDELTLITGVRYAHTEFSSTGFLSINNDKFNFGGNSSLDISIPLPQAKITYSEYYPSAHLRYEPTEDLLIRASLWTSYTRPSFSQARAFAKFDSRIVLCDPSTGECDDEANGASAIDLQGYILGEDNGLKVGNPNLVAMSSTNFDTSIGWYPSENLFLEASFFHKNIDNFIYDAVGIRQALNELPLTLPVDHVSAFAIPQDLILNSTSITLNGDKAKVTGVELSYNQFFDNGLFIQSNATFLTSEANVDEKIRAEKIQMPSQADTTFNLSLGWENDDFSTRIIGNYRSELLDAIASEPSFDRYIDAITTIDFKVKYDVNKQISIYFDAVNITDEVDLEYIDGNSLSGGNVVFKQESYGATYQLGLTYKFY
ncbi:TonB-dependent receptor [Colwellia sp. MB02u-18]|uniref:TonB-dependent receptor n=1 Tax=unclassified Colwellia TaxID=196834 RepID=UPI0015F6B836|nr:MULTISPECIES: TonB-dependent receptor [unclassified Colwellia]MBA6225372.1 TonB-dependent receptor [Colwellia sp. MB3u-45]MBA6267178.1 TonB-dependent receptor [Colwellia sp. MB3u-43]MBA6322790.1 TonB-dependent receptor [Colwellia sp. MB02u-19]MBA6324802.1 TonB-dependent receptor [Colwellia sp. MB02u-18]MBA6331007.1 TonB-dependent receptor [Colwellia sp. MB02u-12]